MSAPRATVPLPSPPLQRVALGQGVAGQELPPTPGCSEQAPLFRSYMPRLVGFKSARGPEPVPPEDPAWSVAEEAAPEEPVPAMHQALHLCVVEQFQPGRPFTGASKAIYRL